MASPQGSEDGLDPREAAIPILLVEDDPDIAADIVGGLGRRGYGVTHAANGAEGLRLAAGGGFAALVCDRMLPEMNGLALIEALRRAGSVLPVLMLSAMGETPDRILGLTTGADDYLPKPFAMDELAARLAALLRRSSRPPQTDLVAGPLALDLVARTVHRNGRRLDLSPKEFELLAYLMRHYGQLVTRPMLLRDVWHYSFTPTTNVIDVHMVNLRRKLGGPDEPPLIHAVRGKGFVLSAEAPA